MSDQKTEKPTPRRRQKAREKGQVARTHDLPSALAVASAFGILWYSAPSAVEAWRNFLRVSLDFSMSSSIQPNSPIFLWGGVQLVRWVAPAMFGAFAIAFFSTVMQGGVVFAADSLIPNIERLSPAGKVRQLFSLSGLSALLKSLLPFGAILYLAVKVILREAPSIVSASTLDFRSFVILTCRLAFEVTWKSILVLLIWSGIDYLLMWRKHETDLRMSKEDLRQEFKETEGNPAVKSRIRQLQRRVRRQQMLQDTQKATVVIANPTHFAIAVRYEVDMEAPIVVAKGRDLLAQQIKEVAQWHGIPIVENPPLAHLMYRTVAVGRAIPAKLYTAIAEILAVVYRAQVNARQRAR